MHQLPKALYRIAKNNGTMFRMGSLVEKINTHNNKVVSLSHAAGNDEPFDFVVSNADTRHLYEALCPEANPRRSPQSESARSTSAYNMLWHDPDPTPLRAPHTVLFPVDYEDEFKALFERRQVPRLPAVYLCDQTLNHGTQHPAGGHIVFGMINAPEASLDDDVKPSQRAFETMAMIAKNRKYLSTDSQGSLATRTPQDLAERFPDSGGALYRPASNNWKSAFARAGNHSSKVKACSLLLARHTLEGVPMAMLSGWHAANQLHQQFPLPTFPTRFRIMKIFMSGATGFVGRHLILRLLRDGHEITVWARNPSKAALTLGGEVKVIGGADNFQLREDALDGFDAVINLAGAPIAGGRWTRKRKQLIRDSRVHTTEALVKACQTVKAPPAVFISASAGLLRPRPVGCCFP